MANASASHTDQPPSDLTQPPTAVSTNHITPTLTKDILRSNYTKAQLQKLCRDMGLSKVWDTKDKLIEKIIENSPSHDNTPSDANSSTSLLPSDCTAQKWYDQIYHEIKCLKSENEAKNSKIVELNEVIRNMQKQMENVFARLASLESSQGNHRSTPAPQDTHNTSPPQMDQTLLLGDINLNMVRATDLTAKCKIRTLGDANIDLLKCWVQEKLTWTPTKCVLYCGLNDIMETECPNSIIDNLSSLVSELKCKNENMEICVSEIVPSLQSDTLLTKIDSFNEQVRKWATVNELVTVNLDPYFKLGTGKIDESCYKAYGENQGSLLNRTGAVRLLEAISSQYHNFKDCVNWDKVRRNKDARQIPPRHTQQHHQGHPFPRTQDHVDLDGWQTVGNDRRGRKYHHTSPDRSHARPHLNTAAKHHPSPDRSHARPHLNTAARHHPSPDRPHGRGPHLDSAAKYLDPALPYRPHGRRTHPDPTVLRHTYSTRKPTTPNHSYSRINSRTGCSNCGESNHHVSDCYFDHKILCTFCHRYGHKNRLCKQYTP